ncbi:hypothetical protein MHH52_18830 [Paenibacillus sp. FSL K6-0276]|uniref:hypothetical protein n=1 Tax=Paenibacillus sp. FSL K6-0276 TaxID=2921450 RepID=UPI0030EC5921
MKKKTRRLSVIALLSTAVFTACSAPVSTNATNTTESQNTTEERSNSAKGAFNGRLC